tara:strand:- start:880 stop:1125 length:246 start_codon:yes stop_codon:yes gene_type:complete
MTPKQEEALRDYLQEVITPLIEQVLVKKLGQAMTFAAEELMQPKREWQGLTDEEVITMSRYDLEYAALIGEVQKKLKEKNR